MYQVIRQDDIGIEFGARRRVGGFVGVVGLLTNRDSMGWRNAKSIACTPRMYKHHASAWRAARKLADMF